MNLEGNERWRFDLNYTSYAGNIVGDVAQTYASEILLCSFRRKGQNSENRI
jgi:hypothetical protein